MVIRTAVEQNKFLFGALLLFGGWVALTGLNVLDGMGPLVIGEWVGQHGVGGLVGLVALLTILTFVVLLYGELGERDPAPEEWPPE